MSPTVFSYEKEFVITEILNDDVIKVERLDPSIEVEPGDLLLIYSHASKSILGYARVQVMNIEPDFFTATVQTHNKSGLIRPENYLKKVDLTKTKNDEMPARFDLIYKENRKAASKYKPLVYTGLAQGFTASNLMKKEWLAGPSILGYGINNRWQVNTNLISTMFKIFNVSIKNTIFSNDDYEIAVENGFQYYNEKTKGSYQFTGYLDMVSNSNFNSYIKLRVFTQKPQDEYLYNSEEYLNNLNLELTLSYGYLFNNWNRLLFGPKIDVNKKKIGGVVGYYIIDKEFHTMIGVSSNDFSEFKIGKQGYLLNLDFWWRF
ncbi:MAG: hypothetical protein H7336_11635 [Bacteriovorax sp.]|nr:hypothetical protein [Bacteriovorax sp.]